MDERETIVETLAAHKGGMKTSEVAELLGCSVTKINLLVRKGRIPHFKISDMTRFDPEVLARWLEHRTTPDFLDSKSRTR